ncbi:Hok/Gef family protein [Klebsiella pneumoniae]|nr:Hok/Gef family protein [Klebsiella pneumoniae]
MRNKYLLFGLVVILLHLILLLTGWFVSSICELQIRQGNH